MTHCQDSKMGPAGQPDIRVPAGLGPSSCQVQFTGEAFRAWVRSLGPCPPSARLRRHESAGAKAGRANGDICDALRARADGRKAHRVSLSRLPHADLAVGRAPSALGDDGPLRVDRLQPAAPPAPGPVSGAGH